MGLERIARALSNVERIGMTPELARRLGLASEDATRGRLMAQAEEDRAHLGVYLLGSYVVDDTDLWGDGEIYWWSIPALVDREGKSIREPLHGLPNGMAPHKVGSLEWMTNVSLAEPPLLAVIPPVADLAGCTLRLAFYDDDGARANFAAAMQAGLEAYGNLSGDPLQGADSVIAPVRDAIFRALKAEEDDILVDQDVILRRGETSRFGAGLVGSVINSMVRVYWFVRDEERTEQFGPIALHKGQSETVRFATPLRAGGRLAVFARGATVHCESFGDLDTDTPFTNRVIEARQEPALSEGFTVHGQGAAKLIAFYTPP